MSDFNEFEDYEIDKDFLSDKTKKKRKNSKDKGNRGELTLVKLLNTRFNTQEFSRVVGSGNRWSHVAVVAKHYLGDICSPPNFKYLIECKFGYPQIDLCNTFDNGIPQLNEFLKQAEKDAGMAGKEPLVCWKKNHQPWLAVVKGLDRTFDYQLKYNDWVMVSLTKLLSLEDDFFLL